MRWGRDNHVLGLEGHDEQGCVQHVLQQVKGVYGELVRQNEDGQDKVWWGG